MDGVCLGFVDNLATQQYCFSITTNITFYMHINGFCIVLTVSMLCFKIYMEVM